MSENYYYSSLSGDEIEATLLGAVRGDIDQNRTTSWKARARQNIGAGESDSTFKILGYFDTYEEMIQSLQQLPAPGDAYGIGTASPYDIYVYDGIHDTWVNNGPIVLSDAVIDDEDIATDTTWSSSKINTEVGAVRTLANAAQSAADAAQNTADGAQTAAEMAQTTADSSVSYASAQSLSTGQKQQARNNISASGTLEVFPLTVASNVTLAASTNAAYSVSAARAGYRTLGIVGVRLEYPNGVLLYFFGLVGENASVKVRNTWTSGQQTFTVYADVLYEKL